MKRILFLVLACLVMTAVDLQAAVITEDDSTFGDSLSSAFVINSSDFYYDSDFTKGPGSTWGTTVAGTYANRDYDYYSLVMTRDTSGSISLSGMDGSVGVWQQLSGSTWKRLFVVSGTTLELDFAKGTYVVGVAGLGANGGASGFSNGSVNGGEYNLNISLAPIATPEPSAFILTGMGLLGLFGARKKFSRSQNKPA